MAGMLRQGCYLKKHFYVVILLFCMACIQGCGTLRSYKPLPQELESGVQMPGFHHVRSWGDVHSESLERSAIQSLQQERAANNGKLAPEISVLALSGGGSDGAFGAGFLCGWTKSGTRPSFKLVTGISTGALMAPYAFLGPAYDARLKKVYTNISDKTIYQQHNLFAILLSLINVEILPSLADSAPLAKLIAEEIDANMLRKIAAEHKKGRRLLIGTTQFNAQRLVIWNMGEIAASGSPQALALFRKIMLASSSLPVSFPPQYFTVTAEGKFFEEMHVDGGIEAQVVLYENAITAFSKANGFEFAQRPRHLYIIRNEKVYSEWENVKPRIRTIAVRAIDSLTKSQGIGDLFRLYTYAQRDNINYHLASIPKDFTQKENSPFDNSYMRKLFDVGYRFGKSEYSWRAYPPGFEPNRK